jgi:hypothetical protein
MVESKQAKLELEVILELEFGPNEEFNLPELISRKRVVNSTKAPRFKSTHTKVRFINK